MQPWKSLSATVHVGNQTDGWNLASPPAENFDEPRVFRFSVYFSAPFEARPVVHVGLAGLDVDQRDACRLTLNASEISNTGFVAEIATWRETRVYSVVFSWLALGA